MTFVDYDLIIKAGRLFCAKNNIDGPGSVAIKDGKIVSINEQITYYQISRVWEVIHFFSSKFI